jgi:hypothetical protein
VLTALQLVDDSPGSGESAAPARAITLIQINAS